VLKSIQIGSKIWRTGRKFLYALKESAVYTVLVFSKYTVYVCELV